MGTERHGWRRVEAFSLAVGGMLDCLRRVMPGSQVVKRDRGRVAKCAAVNKPVNRSGGRRFLESDVFAAAR